MKSLEGKAVVVTGAASGIGRALAFELAGAGARLALADVDAPRLDEVAAAIRSRGAACITRIVDVASEMDVSALAAEVEQAYGGADMVINNAGVSLVAPVSSLGLRWAAKIGRALLYHDHGVWGLGSDAPEPGSHKPIF